jgi:uncharacterized protein YjbJ (UPF0337 family)
LGMPLLTRERSLHVYRCRTSDAHSADRAARDSALGRRTEEVVMNEKLDQMKGKAKEQAGKLTDDEELEAEGKADQAKGNAKEAWEHTKDAARDVTR